MNLFWKYALVALVVLAVFVFFFFIFRRRKSVVEKYLPPCVYEGESKDGLFMTLDGHTVNFGIGARVERLPEGGFIILWARRSSVKFLPGGILEGSMELTNGVVYGTLLPEPVFPRKSPRILPEERKNE